MLNTTFSQTVREKELKEHCQKIGRDLTKIIGVLFQGEQPSKKPYEPRPFRYARSACLDTRSLIPRDHRPQGTWWSQGARMRGLPPNVQPGCANSKNRIGCSRYRNAATTSSPSKIRVHFLALMRIS